MDFELYEKIVDECAAEGHALLWLHHMGEPLVYPLICEAIEYAVKKLGRPPSISTNGLLLDRHMLQNLKDAGASFMMICLSSMRKGAYEHIRVGGTFEVLVENVHTALEVGGFDIMIQAMDTIYNHDETVDAYYEEFGGKREGFRVEKWPVNKFKPGGRYIGYNEPLIPSCHLLASHFVICQDGRVPICCFDYDCLVSCGDVSEHSISYIAEHGFDGRIASIRSGQLDSMPACKECFDMNWRNELSPERFVPHWGSCI